MEKITHAKAQGFIKLLEVDTKMDSVYNAATAGVQNDIIMASGIESLACAIAITQPISFDITTEAGVGVPQVTDADIIYEIAGDKTINIDFGDFDRQVNHAVLYEVAEGYDRDTLKNIGGITIHKIKGPSNVYFQLVADDVADGFFTDYITRPKYRATLY